MRLRRVPLFLSVLVVAAVCTPPAAAEEQRTLAPQARVRITTADTFVRPKGFPRTFEGHVVQLDDRALTVRPHWSPAVVVIPREAIARLDVQTRPSKRGVGALAGVGLAGLAGLAIGHGADEAPIVILATAPVGALFGYLLGPGAKWDKRVPVQNVALAVAPLRGHGVGFSVSVGF